MPTVPTDLLLATPEGDPFAAGDLVAGRLVVVQLVRYFGCLPCQDWLVQLDAVSSVLAARDVGVAAVGGSADYQARWLRDVRGVGVPLFLDPGHRFRDAVSAGDRLGVKLLDPRGAAAYARSLWRGFRPQKVTRDTLQAPGVVILDRYLNVCWQHRGRRIGDYPAVHEVVGAALQLARMTRSARDRDPRPGGAS